MYLQHAFIVAVILIAGNSDAFLVWIATAFKEPVSPKVLYAVVFSFWSLAGAFAGRFAYPVALAFQQADIYSSSFLK